MILKDLSKNNISLQNGEDLYTFFRSIRSLRREMPLKKAFKQKKVETVKIKTKVEDYINTCTEEQTQFLIKKLNLLRKDFL